MVGTWRGPGEVLDCLNTGHFVGAGSGRLGQIITGLLRGKNLLVRVEVEGYFSDPGTPLSPPPHRWLWDPILTYNVISPSLIPEAFLWNAQGKTLPISTRLFTCHPGCVTIWEAQTSSHLGQLKTMYPLGEL